MAGYDVDDIDDINDDLGDVGAIPGGRRPRRPGADAPDAPDAFAPTADGAERPARADDSRGFLNAEWARTRGDWSFAALAALGYVAIVAAVFLALAGSWGAFPGIVRGLVGATILAGAYWAALWPRFARNKAIARLFFTIGAAMFLVVLALVSPDMPTSWGTETFWADLADAVVDATGPWAFGVFLLATFLTSRSLQVVAALATLVWISASDSAYDPHAAIAVCVVGEYWAWRRSSRVVATIYAALCCWTLVSEPSLWRNPASLAPLTAGLAFLAFWYGANYKSAWLRGAALVVGGLALGAAAFPLYWEWALGSDVIAKHGAGGAYVVSALPAFAFVVFCSHMIFSGTNRSTPRFVLGVSLAASWTIALVVVASTRFGMTSAAAVLFGAALCFFALIVAEKKLVANPAVQKTAHDRSRRPTTDAAEDDPELNDLVDAETRATRNRPGGAVETAWFVVFHKAWEDLKTPALYAVVLLQIMMVLFASM